MIESIITSKATREILGLLFSHPNEKFYMRQVERLTGLQINAVRRELKKLESAGFVLSETTGNQMYFWLNRQNPIYGELKNIMFKTQIIGVNLRDLVKKITDITVAFIYGSVAKGEENSSSDIDLMVVGSIDSLKLHAEINKIEDKINRTVNYNLVREDELKTKTTDFFKRVLHEKKIFLIGNENVLRELT